MGQRLNIDALQAMCAIEDFGGVTRAAEHLALSQSAVSHKIKRLEAGLDCVLLARRPDAPLLTQEGVQLVGYARRILSLHDEALLSLSKRPLTGKIKLGMTEDTTSSDLSLILGRFIRLHPNVSVRTQVRQSLELEEALETGEIDLAVMQLFTHRLRGSDINLYDDHLCWVKAHDVELDFNKPLPFLAYDAKCFYKHWAMDAVQNAGVILEVVLECASSAGIVSGVHAGLGIALLPGQHVTSKMEVIGERLPPPPGVTFAVRQSRKARSKPVATLADEIARASSTLGKLTAA